MNLIYMMADIVLSCSTDPEAFGRVPIESQSMGKVVVASNHGGHVETISLGLSGFLYSPTKPNELAEAILETLSSEIYLDKDFQSKRRKLILENYTVQKMCEKTVEVYNNVLSN